MRRYKQALKNLPSDFKRMSGFSLPSKREICKSETEIEVVIIDVASTEIERPKKNRSHTIAASKNVRR
jgi:hypothetical protein